MNKRIIRFKICIHCKQQYQCPKKMGIGVWSKRKYCSRECKDRSVKPKGIHAPAWKETGLGYWGVHAWMEREFGRPALCEHCGTTTATKYEWANVSGEYKRDRNDFIRLCTKCHNKYDEPWKKRTRDQMGRFA